MTTKIITGTLRIVVKAGMKLQEPKKTTYNKSGIKWHQTFDKMDIGTHISVSKNYSQNAMSARTMYCKKKGNKHKKFIGRTDNRGKFNITRVA